MDNLQTLGVLLFFSAIFETNCLSQDESLLKFKIFIHKFSKTYEWESDEFSKRLTIFKENLERYEHLNLHFGNGSEVYGINKFSDWTQDEFREFLKQTNSTKIFGKKQDLNKAVINKKHFDREMLKKYNIPKKFDWRDSKYSIVTKIKNQKHCGGCWAFSTVETVESMMALKTKKDAPVLSVQQVIDCTYGSHGCQGGDTCATLLWMVKSNTTLVAENLYPLKDISEYCKIFPPHQPGIHVKDFTCKNYIENEYEMLKILSTVGPVTVSVDASTWNDYMGGIIQFHCENHNNHAVQIVGYDTTGEIPFFIVRNSWGTDYGIDGYLHVKVGDNVCGIATEVSTVIV